MTIKVTKEGFVNIKDLKNLIDISKIVSYSVKEDKGNIKLKFYDKGNKLVKPYKETK